MKRCIPWILAGLSAGILLGVTLGEGWSVIGAPQVLFGKGGDRLYVATIGVEARF